MAMDKQIEHILSGKRRVSASIIPDVSTSV